MTNRSDILCIGSVLWDVVGRTDVEMPPGADRPGRIERIPGGVAMNIAMTVRRFGLAPTLLTHIGHDAEGDALLAACASLGVATDFVTRLPDLPTDIYMAIEGADGLVAAIADAHSLERAGEAILTPLKDGRLGNATSPYQGIAALDGNLTAELLSSIAASPLFAALDLRIAPASPGKAERLVPLLGHPRATFYVNVEEAGIMCGARFEDAPTAAEALIAQGAERVLVTDGPRAATFRSRQQIATEMPPAVRQKRVTGAGDTFMAAHVAAETNGASPDDALSRALEAAATYVSGTNI
ncbi:MAG: PfkB family carbohydrate kinase [Pikeienuella sp.]